MLYEVVMPSLCNNHYTFFLLMLTHLFSTNRHPAARSRSFQARVAGGRMFVSAVS